MGFGTSIKLLTPRPAAEVSWYKKYAPHLILGGGAITALIAYFSLRKRGKK